MDFKAFISCFEFCREHESPWIKMHYARPRRSALSPKSKKKVIKFTTPSLSELGPGQILDATAPGKYRAVLGGVIHSFTHLYS